MRKVKKGLYSNKAITILILAVLFASIIIPLSSKLVKADDSLPGATTQPATQPSSSGGITVANTGIFKWFSDKWDLWKEGVSVNKDNKQAIGDMVKYFLLILVIILVYSAFKYANFPENKFLAFVLAVAVGFLATFLITTNELLTMLSSYTALGVTIGIFVPILILTFFTLVVASKGSPIGILVQRIMWIIYSVYLFAKVGLLWLVTQYVQIDPSTNTAKLIPGVNGVPEWLATLLGAPITAGAGGKNTVDVNWFTNILSTKDSTIMLILLVVAIAVFVIMGVGGKAITYWLMKEKTDADVTSQRGIIDRSQALRKAEADALESSGKR